MGKVLDRSPGSVHGSVWRWLLLSTLRCGLLTPDFVSAGNLDLWHVGGTDISLDILQRLAKRGNLKDVHCSAHCKTTPGDLLPLESDIVLDDQLSWNCNCCRHDVHRQSMIWCSILVARRLRNV